MFVSMNGRGPSIDRSTCVSAARLSTAVGRCSANTRATASRVRDVACTNVTRGLLERRLEIRQAARVGQLVEDDEAISGVVEGVAERGWSR